MEPFNEPDYWSGQGTPQHLYDIMVLLQSSPNFQGTELVGASTLSSDAAQSWCDVIKSPTTYGSTHQLAGATDSYVNFFLNVQANGDQAYNPELHSLAEAIYDAEYGRHSHHDLVATGIPKLMAGFTADGQHNTQVLGRRDRLLGISTYSLFFRSTVRSRSSSRSISAPS